MDLYADYNMLRNSYHEGFEFMKNLPIINQETKKAEQKTVHSGTLSLEIAIACFIFNNKTNKSTYRIMKGMVSEFTRYLNKKERCSRL